MRITGQALRLSPESTMWRMPGSRQPAGRLSDGCWQKPAEAGMAMAGQPARDPATGPEVTRILFDSCTGRSHEGFCIWFTGLSGAGKSTTAEALTALLQGRGSRVTLLDGDAVRARAPDLGFSREDRDANVLRIGLAASQAVKAGLVAVCAAISPYGSTRDAVRNMIGSDRFVEVYVNTPIGICEERDPKGLYAMARRGELKNFTGIDGPYEAPAAPEVELETVHRSAEDNAQVVLTELQARGFVG